MRVTCRTAGARYTPFMASLSRGAVGSLSALALLACAACVGDSASVGLTQSPTQPDGGGNAGNGTGNASSSSSSGGSSSSSSGAIDPGMGTHTDAGPTGPTNYCAGVVPPAGADFLCLDFDGAARDTGWTRTTSVTNGGTSMAIDTLFQSSPSSLDAFTPVATGAPQRTAKSEWTAVGAGAVKTISSSFWINPATLGGGVVPPQDGYSDLASVGIPGLTLDFVLFEANHGTAGGSRAYGVCITDTRSAAFIGCDKIATSLPTELCTKVTLTMSNVGGTLPIVKYNDATVLTKSTSSFMSTQAVVAYGIATLGNTNPVHVRYDGLAATVTR